MKAINGKTTDVLDIGEVLIIPKKTIIDTAHDAEKKLKEELKTHTVVK